MYAHLIKIIYFIMQWKYEMYEYEKFAIQKLQNNRLSSKLTLTDR